MARDGRKPGAPPGLLAAGESARRANGRPRKGGGRPGSGRLRLLTAFLAAAAAGLVLLIAAGTLYALLRDPESFPGGVSRRTGDGTGAAPGSETGMFTGIGRLRIAAGGQTAVLLSIVFPYPPGDRAFAEELVSKIPLFREIVRNYFGGLSQEELNTLDEGKAKAEILRSFNDELRLGRIETLFFNDLLILE